MVEGNADDKSESNSSASFLKDIDTRLFLYVDGTVFHIISCCLSPQAAAVPTYIVSGHTVAEQRPIQ